MIIKKCGNHLLSTFFLFFSSTIIAAESSPRDFYVSSTLQPAYATLSGTSNNATPLHQPTLARKREAKDFYARWAAMFFYGKMSEKSFAQALIFQNKFQGYGQADQYSFEIAYSLGRDNLLWKIFRPFVSNIEIAANVSFLDDPQRPIWQFNPFFMVRWRNFPWDHLLTTTFGIGDGLSVGSAVPSKEQLNKAPGDLRKTLNLLIFEATFSLPKYPNWQLVYRIHHRSGIFGLYSPSLIGSNVIGLGLRYWA